MKKKSKKKNNRYFTYLISRYLILILLSINNLYLFYLIFTPLTVYPVLFVLKLFSNATLITADIILLKNTYIKIIPACVAGAAYYFLLILNLTTPIEEGKRTKSLLFLFGAFLGANILRIILFSYLAANGFQYFDFTHKATWYVGSTLLLVIIWFTNVKIFKIKEIPVFSDFKLIYSQIRGKNK